MLYLTTDHVDDKKKPELDKWSIWSGSTAAKQAEYMRDLAWY